MKFKFYPIESRIYDFLEFPSLIFAKDANEKSEEGIKDDEGISVEYFDLIEKAKDKLKLYRADIELFYTGQFLGDYNFIDLVSRLNRIFGYKSEEEYLEMLLGLSEDEINTSIAYSIMAKNENVQKYSEEIMDKAKAVVADGKQLVSLIKELSTEAATKWTLFLIVEEPGKYMNMYVDLMRNILPIFIESYSHYEEEVKTYGQDLVDFLNEKGPKGIEEVTYAILDQKVADNEANNILISVTMAFGIVMYGVGEHGYMAWGLRVEEAFRKMKEISENKVNERVQIFKNLGDKTRYEVIKLIASNETSVKEIARILGVSSATISYHINNLVQSKIVRLDRVDNKYIFVVDYKMLEETMKDFKEDILFPKEL